MICVIKGNDLYLRAQGWSPSLDFVWKCSKVNQNYWAGNPYFNIEAAYTLALGLVAKIRSRMVR